MDPTSGNPSTTRATIVIKAISNRLVGFSSYRLIARNYNEIMKGFVQTGIRGQSIFLALQTIKYSLTISKFCQFYQIKIILTYLMIDYI